MTKKTKNSSILDADKQKATIAHVNDVVKKASNGLVEEQLTQIFNILEATN
jgi:hypothetical protein